MTRWIKQLWSDYFNASWSVRSRLFCVAVIITYAAMRLGTGLRHQGALHAAFWLSLAGSYLSTIVDIRTYRRARQSREAGESGE